MVKAMKPGIRVIYALPMTWKKAAEYVKGGGNVWTIFQSDALGLAMCLGGPIRRAEQGKNKRNAWHYHPNMAPESHIYFGTTGIRY